MAMETRDAVLMRESEPKPRRVGTFTLGMTLVVSGLAMLACFFFPRLNLTWLAKLSPCILIALGVETILAARGGRRIKYDWAGMLLIFLLAVFTMVLCAGAWVFSNLQDMNSCARDANENHYDLTYSFLNGQDRHTMSLKAGDTLKLNTATYQGWMQMTIYRENGETLYAPSYVYGEETIPITESGEYVILTHAHWASGYFSLTRIRAEGGEGFAVLEEPDTAGDTAPSGASESVEASEAP